MRPGADEDEEGESEDALSDSLAVDANASPESIGRGVAQLERWVTGVEAGVSCIYQEGDRSLEGPDRDEVTGHQLSRVGSIALSVAVAGWVPNDRAPRLRAPVQRRGRLAADHETSQRGFVGGSGT